ncbi:MAG: hypothetical protein E7I48_05050 [Clostridium celatum]|nr:hypothetical protein [Clostridium celatum]
MVKVTVYSISSPTTTVVLFTVLVALIAGEFTSSCIPNPVTQYLSPLEVHLTVVDVCPLSKLINGDGLAFTFVISHPCLPPIILVPFGY